MFQFLVNCLQSNEVCENVFVDVCVVLFIYMNMFCIIIVVFITNITDIHSDVNVR